MKDNSIVTFANCVSAVGLKANAVAAAVRAGVSGLVESDWFTDVKGKLVTIAAVSEQIEKDYQTQVRYLYLAQLCLEGLQEFFLSQNSMCTQVYLLLGLANTNRPGSLEQVELPFILQKFREIFSRWEIDIEIEVVRSGNPSSIECIQKANQLLRDDPMAICVVGAVDSLLIPDTLFWLERQRRLMSSSFGRNHGLSAGEASAFFIVESTVGARRRFRQNLITLSGIGTAHEEGFLLSKKPSLGVGLTQACQVALNDADCSPKEIVAVFGDLNGEFFRAREWGLAELRCFGNCNELRSLWHPADCHGDTGAASAAVLLSIATVWLMNSWADGPILIFSIDDYGKCGAAILRRPK